MYLVNEELLPLGRVEHFGRVLRDERVKEGVEALVVPPLGAQNPAEPLSLLTTGAEVARDLDEAGGLREVDGRVTDLGEEDGADGRVVLEAVENADALNLRGSAVDERLAELDGVRLRGRGELSATWARAGRAEIGRTSSA
jgi:hypothetical protein